MRYLAVKKVADRAAPGGCGVLYFPTETRPPLLPSCPQVLHVT